MKNNGITLVALIITIIVLLILAGVSLNFLFNGGILEKSQLAVNEYKNTADAEKNLLDDINKYLEDKLNNNENDEFQVKKDGSFDGKQNSPKLASNMTAIYWEGDVEKQLTASDDIDEWSKWYNYVPATDNPEIDDDDLNISKWANAITDDGSYWVWIPRFAYKINSDNETIDIKFINGTQNIAADGTECKYAKDVTEKTPQTDFYIVHPAFTADVNNGGWSKELEGIWVAKYEAGAEVYKNSSWQGKDDYWNNDSGDIAIGDTVRLVSKPGIKSWRCINIANAYTNSKNYNTSCGSHLMKNSEWGAVAYLTHSCYGRNATEVTKNSKTDYVTGAGNISENKLQSSTGNLYGIYDLNGGSYERVAAYYNGYNTPNFSNEEFLDVNGNMFAKYNGISDEYATVYTGRDYSKDYKRGDATTETRGWNGDNYGFVDGNDDNTFFYRDGSADAGETAGIFAATGTSGKHDFNLSFRVVLCY